MLKICLILSRQASPLRGMMLESWPEGTNGSVNSAMWIPLFPAQFFDPRSVYIASLIILMNYGHFSVRCNYPFASRSWSTALKPWRWVVVWRGRWLSVNLPCMVGTFNNNASEALEPWRCPDPRKWLDSIIMPVSCLLCWNLSLPFPPYLLEWRNLCARPLH